MGNSVIPKILFTLSLISLLGCSDKTAAPQNAPSSDPSNQTATSTIESQEVFSLTERSCRASLHKWILQNSKDQKVSQSRLILEMVKTFGLCKKTTLESEKFKISSKMNPRSPVVPKIRLAIVADTKKPIDEICNESEILKNENTLIKFDFEYKESSDRACQFATFYTIKKNQLSEPISLPSTQELNFQVVESSPENKPIGCGKFGKACKATTCPKGLHCYLSEGCAVCALSAPPKDTVKKSDTQKDNTWIKAVKEIKKAPSEEHVPLVYKKMDTYLTCRPDKDLARTSFCVLYPENECCRPSGCGVGQKCCFNYVRCSEGWSVTEATCKDALSYCL